MLKITVLGEEHWDEDNDEFVYPESFELELEHSLVALSKWESKFEKPFLDDTEKSSDEALYYVYCMILTPDVSEDVLQSLSNENLIEVNDYIQAKMTATWFKQARLESKSSEVITAELIYYWMNMFQIPMACENWHLNRLFTLIKIHNHKASPPKKMSRQELAAQRRDLNAQRKAQLGSRG